MDLLKLLEAPAGPLLVDFPDDEPESSGEPVVLACPVYYSVNKAETAETDDEEAALRREIAALRPWYDMALSQRKRTTVGLSDIGLEALGGFIYAVVKDRKPENPRKDIEMPVTVKFAVEDLKAYYIEAITAQPGRGGVSSQKLQEWFWGETKAGELLLNLKRVCEASPDTSMNRIGHFIAPGYIAGRKVE